MHLSGFNLGHALSGFYNRNVSVEFESTYIGSKKITNDLMNLKAGIIPNGIKIRYDSSGIISKSIEEIYMLATNSKPLELEDYLDYINTYEPDETKDCDIERKLKAFAQAMKENHIPKHEMTQLLIKYNDGNFLGENVTLAFGADIAPFTKEDRDALMGNKSRFVRPLDSYDPHIHRKVLIRKQFSNGAKSMYFLLDTASLNIIQIEPKDLSSKYNFSFENKKQEKKMGELE